MFQSLLLNLTLQCCPHQHHQQQPYCREPQPSKQLLKLPCDYHITPVMRTAAICWAPCCTLHRYAVIIISTCSSPTGGPSSPKGPVLTLYMLAPQAGSDAAMHSTQADQAAALGTPTQHTTAEASYD
jgi:hypothetical protein